MIKGRGHRRGTSGNSAISTSLVPKTAILFSSYYDYSTRYMYDFSSSLCGCFTRRCLFIWGKPLALLQCCSVRGRQYCGAFGDLFPFSFFLPTTITVTYRLGVFHHDLLITKLHYIKFKKYTDGIYSSKGVLLGYQKI